MKFTQLTLTVCLLFFLATFYSSFLYANHIVGGHVSYTYLGDDNYEIEFIIYRDCASDGAPFDQEISVGIFVSNSSTQTYTSIEQLMVPFSDIELLMPELCMFTPNGVCLEYATYTFTTNLPSINEKYFIAHQRCCRIHDPTNIVEFDQEQQGSTLAIVLSPEATAVSNSSPIFNPSKPLQACLGEAFTIEDIYAVDNNLDNSSDSLVYELCKPLIGGGNSGTIDNPGDGTACDGIMPDPICSPPYLPVEYNPGYNEIEPLGSSSTFSIDSSTGIISGIGLEVGRFVIGVCVTEYRDSVLLSSSIRDFVINIEGLVATNEIEQASWEIFPQPANDYIFIKTDDHFSSNVSLKIFDATGQLLSEHRLNNTDTQRIDTHHLNAGLHFYQIQKDGLTLKSGKLLKL